MFFSEIHNWQGDPAVKQILVFSTEEAQAEFNRASAEGIAQDIEIASIGASHKLRAVLDSKERYIPIIRDGIDGKLIWEDNTTCNNYLDALTISAGMLTAIIEHTFNKQIISLNKQILNLKDKHENNKT